MSFWMKGLIGYLLLVSVITQMLPDKKYEQYVRLFTGFLLILLVLRPILKVSSADAFLEEKISAFVKEQEKLEERTRQQSGILQEESEEGIEIREVEMVKVEVQTDE